MANPMQVKLVIFDTTHTRLLGKTDIIASFDATRAVKTIDIDPIKFIDEDTLMVSERKCTITFGNIYNSYKYVKDRLDTIEELIATVHKNFNSYYWDNYGIDYDDINNTRIINYIKPVIKLKDDTLYSDLALHILAYPVYYLTSNSIGYIPIINEDEDKYNRYDEVYKKERGKYHNILVEVYFYDKLQYVGVALVNTLKFNIKSQEWSLEFTDAIGVMITCLDKLGSLPSLYQDVDYSGLFLKHLYDIPKITIEMMYPTLRDIFNYKGFYTYYGSSITLTVKCTYGVNHSSLGCLYDFKLEDSNGAIAINTLPSNNGYRLAPRVDNTDGGGFPFYQYEKYIHYRVRKDNQNNNIAEIDVLFTEIYRERNDSSGQWLNNYHILRTSLQIVFGLSSCIYYCGNRNMDTIWGYDDYVDVLDVVLFEYMNKIGGSWINSGISADWDTGVYPGAIASYNYGFTATNPITFGTSPTPSQEMQNLFTAYNDEGFNSQISILDAYKLHLLSKVETIYSRGYDIIRKPFKKSTTTNFTVNGRYIKELTIEPYYYEKPDLSVIENITNWEGKTKDELHTRVNLKDWTASLMETIPPGQTEKITVAIILKDTYYNDIEIGNKIRIYPLYYCLPDEPTTNELYFIVTSIKWSLNELTLEGFRL